MRRTTARPLLLLLLLLGLGAAVSPAKRFLAFRKGTTFFYRLNYKLNMLPYSGMFAQASGFKVGWQLDEPRGSRRPRLSAAELRDAARQLYDSHGLDGQTCLAKSLCQSMQLLGKRDGVLAKILRLMSDPIDLSSSAGANNATWLLDPLVCGSYADRCPLHLLG